MTIRITALVACLAIAHPMFGEADCEKWNTKEYFQTATVEDVTACLGAGADLMARDEADFTPLHQAAASNERPAVIETLLKAGADLQAQDQWQYTPLHRAGADNRNPGVIKTLLKAGAIVEARDQWQYTPLHRAAANNGNPEVIKALIQAGADLEARNQWQLHAPASGGRPQRQCDRRQGPDRRRRRPDGAEQG